MRQEQHKSQTEELAEVKAKLEIYEKWHNSDRHSGTPVRHSQLDWESRSNDEIDLRELWNVIWTGKWKIIAITAVFAIASVFYALSLPNIYKSEALLMPNSQEQKGGMGALAGQFGGLASLAGIKLGGGGTDKTGYALEVLKSREFLYKFIQDNDLKVATMATAGWHRESNTFKYNEDVYNHETKTWVRKVKAPFKPEPSLQETYEQFVKEHLSVSQDEETGMVKLAINHYSPYLAKELVDKLIKAINHTIKQQDMTEATKSIKYFEEELQNTNVAGAQTMFYQLIEQQQQTLMLTKVRDDYVLKVVDRAVVAELKSKPKRAIMCILGVLLGGMVSILVTLVMGLSVRNNNE